MTRLIETALTDSEITNLVEYLADVNVRVVEAIDVLENLFKPVHKRVSNEYELLKNKLELAQEDIECVEMYLDSKGIPRYAVDNQAEYSLVGRIKLL